jgi:hypothetical protein
MSIELDYKRVVDVIFNKLSTNFMFGAILDICRASLSMLQNFKLCFVMRQIYNVTYLLAKTSILYASF